VSGWGAVDRTSTCCLGLTRLLLLGLLLLHGTTPLGANERCTCKLLRREARAVQEAAPCRQCSMAATDGNVPAERLAMQQPSTVNSWSVRKYLWAIACCECTTQTTHKEGTRFECGYISA
jgi:hypothetical protein